MKSLLIVTRDGKQSEYRRKKLDGLEKKIHRLYYDDRLTQHKIAKRFGVGEATLSRFFQQQGWTSRFERRGLPKRKFESDDERREASIERRQETQRRLRELRISIFGTKCDICDIETKGERRKLAIHRKDGSEHHKEVLWRKGLYDDDKIAVGKYTLVFKDTVQEKKAEPEKLMPDFLDSTIKVPKKRGD